MKIRTFNKKLNLNKKTVAHLNRDEMKDLQGGYSVYPCNSVHIICDTKHAQTFCIVCQVTKVPSDCIICP